MCPYLSSANYMGGNLLHNKEIILANEMPFCTGLSQAEVAFNKRRQQVLTHFKIQSVER